ncbi:MULTISPECIES: hypothetical protein [Eikenella]|uniref:hypothetical protein n=1 Tax=Eikenella TaxID=538 RepID=UPI001E39AD42|nr:MULTISPECIES: hypothetical protein [Eikenella]
MNLFGDLTTITRKAYRKLKLCLRPCACSGTTRAFRGWKTSNAGWRKCPTYDDDNGSWLARQPEIEALLDVLHPEACRVYGEHGGMWQSAETFAFFVARMFARNTEASRGMAGTASTEVSPLPPTSQLGGTAQKRNPQAARKIRLNIGCQKILAP